MVGLFHGFEGLSIEGMLVRAKESRLDEEEAEKLALEARRFANEQLRQRILGDIRGLVPEALRGYLVFKDEKQNGEYGGHEASLNLVIPEFATIRIYVIEDWVLKRFEIYPRIPGPFSVVGYGIDLDEDTGDHYMVERLHRYDDFGSALLKAQTMGDTYGDFMMELEYLNSRPKVVYEQAEDELPEQSTSEVLYEVIRKMVREVVREEAYGREIAEGVED
jgi:hypothetical protein